MTFTPLLGMSETVQRVLTRKLTGDRHVTTMTIDDAEHYTPEERADDCGKLSAARAGGAHQGHAGAGIGRIFPVTEESITVEACRSRATGRRSAASISAGIIRPPR